LCLVYGNVRAARLHIDRSRRCRVRRIPNTRESREIAASTNSTGVDIAGEIIGIVRHVHRVVKCTGGGETRTSIDGKVDREHKARSIVKEMDDPRVIAKVRGHTGVHERKVLIAPRDFKSDIVKDCYVVGSHIADIGHIDRKVHACRVPHIGETRGVCLDDRDVRAAVLYIYG